MRIYKLDPGGTKRLAIRNSDGNFTLGDPRLTDRKHGDGNQIYVAREDDAVDLVKKGFSIRVESNTSPGLVRKNLYVDGLKIS